METQNESHYQQEFLEFQGELRSFIYRLLTNHQDTEDIAQETYIRAFQKLAQFRGESSFKTWTFAIATNLCRDYLRKKARWEEDYQDRCRATTYATPSIIQQMQHIAQHSPQGTFVLKEHVDYCFTCMSKTLLLEEQICLILKEIYGFKVSEIIQITQLTEGKVKYALQKARNRFLEIFGTRCSLINKQGVCYQCTELAGLFNPKQDAEAEAQKLKMVKEKDRADYDQLLDLRLQLVKSIDPLQAEGFEFHNYMIENVPNHAAEGKRIMDKKKGK